MWDQGTIQVINIAAVALARDKVPGVKSRERNSTCGTMRRGISEEIADIAREHGLPAHTTLNFISRRDNNDDKLISLEESEAIRSLP